MSAAEQAEQDEFESVSHSQDEGRGGPRGPTRGDLIRHAVGEITDATAVVALAYLATSGVAEATAQVLAGGIVSVALGKRYVAGKMGGRK